MASDPFYPFGLPGINQLGASTQANPLAASLDLMRNAMSSFGQSASLASGSMAQSLNPEDLEKRISELKVVENWLRLNLSMLSSSIQGMEVQLATIKTLRSFVEMGSQPASEDGQQPSPLEVVLGIRKPSATTSPFASNAAPATTPETNSAPSPFSSSPEPPQARQSATPESGGAAHRPADKPATEPDQSSEASAVTPDVSQAAAQAWWDMLQNQFTQIAAATTQAAQAAQFTGSDESGSKDKSGNASARSGATAGKTRSSQKTAASKSKSTAKTASKSPRATKATSSRPAKTPKN